MNQRNIKWGIIGSGDVAEKKSGPAFYKSKGSELVAVMRRNEELARDYAKRHHVKKWYSNAEDLIHDDEVDAVYIATPPAFHSHYSVLCMENNKAVYVEKPMGRNYQECLAMIEVSERTKMPLYVAYYRRALPRFLKIKELIDSGAIGKVLTVNTLMIKKLSLTEKSGELPWRLIPEISGGGLFVDLACHILDFFDFLFGPVIKVHGLASNQMKISNVEDSVTAIYEFENGVIGSGNWCFNGETHKDHNIIVGNKGTIQFSNHGHNPVILENESGTKSFQINNPEHIEQPFIENIIKSLRGESYFPSNKFSASRTSWVMDEILKQYYQPNTKV